MYVGAKFQSDILLPVSRSDGKLQEANAGIHIFEDSTIGDTSVGASTCGIKGDRLGPCCREMEPLQELSFLSNVFSIGMKHQGRET